MFYQGMVLPIESRGTQSDVLFVRIRKQEQLQLANKSSFVRESRSFTVFQIHRKVYRNGKNNYEKSDVPSVI